MARLYGGRLLRNNTRRQIQAAQELRDAIVMSVDSTNRYALVKIQGSNTSIKAWYPENWESTPQYLKPGNAVRINLPGGNKSRIEIMGFGMLLPTAVTGGSVTPVDITPDDCILTGCSLIPANPNSMWATAIPGTYRIDNVTYTLSGMVMDRSDITMDRYDLVLDQVGDTFEFDAASATQFRYDIVVAGEDSDAHVVKGTNASTDPAFPTVPADHVQLGWVLLYPNMTAITEGDINRRYTTPIATALACTIEDDELAWGDTTTTITITVKDQYGNTLSGNYYITMEWKLGNGTLSYNGESQDETASFAFLMSGTAVVTYIRDGNDPGNLSPFIFVSEAYTNASATYAAITLLDGLGLKMGWGL